MQRPRVLIVDDDPDLREALEGSLADEFEVLLAGDGADALDLLATTPVDVVMLDVMMPGMDGEAYLAVHMEKYARIPVMLMSASGNLDRLQGEFPVAETLRKPFGRRAAKEMLRKLLGGGPPPGTQSGPGGARSGNRSAALPRRMTSPP